MSLKMKVGSYYYNKLAGVLYCHNYESGTYAVVNRNFLYDVDAYGKDCTKSTNAKYDLEYECDEYGNEVYSYPVKSSSLNSSTASSAENDITLIANQLKEELRNNVIQMDQLNKNEESYGL